MPLTLLAAAGGALWLGVEFAGLWFLAVITAIIVGVSHVEWLARRPDPGPGHETALAIETFLNTSVYCVLPVALTVNGSGGSIIAALAMTGGIALSSAGEFVISRKIGGAAMLSLFLSNVISTVLASRGLPLANMLFALAALIAFFGYVLQSAMHREKTEAQVREALKAARSAEDAAAVASAAKSTFLATMSHEIRTPLNGVLGMAQAMAADDLSPVQRQRLGVIRESGETLTAILNDILDLSKIEAGRLEIEALDFDLGVTLHTCHATFLPLAQQKGLSLDLDVTPDAAGTYIGDAVRLRQVLYNLLSNAVKFTDQGGVVLTAERTEGLLRLTVTDTGIGIAPDQMDKLFARFVQIDGASTRRHGGTGLGLAISQELCRAMGGDIEVRSLPGQGSAFTVSLPFDRIAGAPASPRGGVQESTAADGVPPLRILAAEDNLVNQVVLTTLLGQAGVVPIMVGDGAQAVAAWSVEEWDLILMDVHMPGMDGLTAVRRIRALEQETGRRRTPVIALTANALVHQIEELRTAGMDAHVAKPIDVALLFSAIEAALDESQALIDSAS